MDYKRILEEELEKLEWEIEQLRRRIKLLEALAEEDEELKLELIGAKALLDLYQADRKDILSALS
jgi:hypothetical protein